MIKRILPTFLLLALMISGSIASAAQSVPHTIGYQGFLKDSAGAAVTTPVSVTVSLYTVSSGGSAIFTENHSSVSVDDGFFAVQIGSASTSAFSALTFDDPYYLGVTINSGTEMSPRIAMNSVPYAINSENTYGFYSTTTAPTSPSGGDVYYNSSNGNVLYYSAATSSWQTLLVDGGVTNDLYVSDTLVIGSTVVSGTSDDAFEVQGNNNNGESEIAWFINNNTGSNADVITLKTGPTTGPGTSNRYIRFKDGDGDNVGYISGNASGGIQFTTAVITTSGNTAACWSAASATSTLGTCTSDARLKGNILYLDNTAYDPSQVLSKGETSLESLMALKVATFEYRLRDENGQLTENLNGVRTKGFIAQDVKALFGDDSVGVDSLGYYTFSNGDLMPHIVEAIKELNAKVNALIDGIVEKIFVKQVDTGKLCLGTEGDLTCVSKAQLDALLEDRDIEPVDSSSNSYNE